ncbi:hypothetical protein ACFSUK_23235 [Sphingobium scionense]|jgi:hypothetical protein|uniref:Uncharacterized protein n=1 Tax=Sphingobium scionense TaxID=1404341 RepID=A0A7W6LQ79_9SPHN|nr:hypothetical protein [Sphingobium scionense]MBB4147608.1 hypothetical protein [Sphingobium scionense]
MSNARRAERAAKSEMHMSDDTFFALSGQVHDAYVKLDDVLAHTLRMSADMIDTARTIGLAPEQGQKLFKRFHGCIDTMMQSREQLLGAHLEATKIRMKTNQAERADGCYSPWSALEEKQADALRLVA